MSTFKRKEPVWQEWKLPQLRVPVIQANANVVVVEKSKDSLFDYWLRVSTLDRGHPLQVPVKLASYHKQALAGKTLNTSTTLHKRNGVWWLTLSFDEDVPLQTEVSAPLVGVDVGIAQAAWHDSISEIAKNVGARRSCEPAWKKRRAQGQASFDEQ